MAASTLSKECLLETVRLFELHGSIRAVSRETGIPRQTFNHRLRAARKAGLLDRVELPEFPDDDIDTDELLDQMGKRFAQRLKREEAQKWFRVKVKKNEPIAIAWVGDPHLGSNGCNVPLLRRDVGLLAGTSNTYAVNMGDTADNWGGRLLRLYAENDVSKQTERKLAQWFLQESGVNWLLWLLGNHDSMDDGFSTYLKTIGGKALPMMDWRAQFIVEFPNGAEFRVDAAHNHKGHSMWNNLHGQERAAHMEEPADLYIAGHHHNWAIKEEEMPDGRKVTLARARGYKWIDSHASRFQFHTHQLGATLLSVINPLTDHPAKRHRIFYDLEDGLDYLEIIRSKYRK